MELSFEQLAAGHLVAGKGGGAVDIINSDGVAISYGLAPGAESCAKVRALMVPGDTLRLGVGVTWLVRAPNRVRRAAYGPGAVDSAANVDFVPRRMSEDELRMKRVVEAVQRKNDAIERRMAAFEKAQGVEPDPEPEPTPEPALEPEPTAER